MTTPASQTNGSAHKEATPAALNTDMAGNASARPGAPTPGGIGLARSSISSAKDTEMPSKNAGAEVVEPRDYDNKDEGKKVSLFPFKPREITIIKDRCELSMREVPNGKRLIIDKLPVIDTLGDSFPQERYFTIYKGRELIAGMHLVLATDHISIVGTMPKHPTAEDPRSQEAFHYLIDTAIKISSERGFKGDVYIYGCSVQSSISFFYGLGGKLTSKVDSHKHSLETSVKAPPLLISRLLFLQKKNSVVSFSSI